MPETGIVIRYYGMLHDIVGKRSEVLNIDDSETALALVKIISTRHGKKFQEFVFDQNGRIRSGLAFAVNGVSIPRSMLSKTKCKDISEFVILPPISGGNISCSAKQFSDIANEAFSILLKKRKIRFAFEYY